MKSAIETQSSGAVLLEKHIRNGGDYARLLKTILFNIGKAIEPLLVQAELEGKKLDIKKESQTHDEITVEDITFV